MIYQTIENITEPDLDNLTEKGLVQLCETILALVIFSPQNEKFIGRIMDLDQDSNLDDSARSCLMSSIQASHDNPVFKDVIGDTPVSSSDEESSSSSPASQEDLNMQI